MQTSRLSTGDLTSRKVNEFSAVTYLREPKPASDNIFGVIQTVLLLWRAFGPSLLKLRSKPEGVMRLPRGRPASKKPKGLHTA